MMIFYIKEIIGYLRLFMHLMPCNIIATSTLLKIKLNKKLQSVFLRNSRWLQLDVIKKLDEKQQLTV